MPPAAPSAFDALELEIGELLADADAARRAAVLANAAAGARLLRLRRELGQVRWVAWLTSLPASERKRLDAAMVAARHIRDESGIRPARWRALAG